MRIFCKTETKNAPLVFLGSTNLNHQNKQTNKQQKKRPQILKQHQDQLFSEGKQDANSYHMARREAQKITEGIPEKTKTRSHLKSDQKKKEEEVEEEGRGPPRRDESFG